MIRLKLDDGKWERISRFLAEDSRMGRPSKDDRLFVEAVIWRSRTRVAWRDLPSEFGPWKSVFNRFDRWSKTGKWERLVAAFPQDIDARWFRSVTARRGARPRVATAEVLPAGPHGRRTGKSG